MESIKRLKCSELVGPPESFDVFTILHLFSFKMPKFVFVHH
jgi:hypothetical protein